MNARGSWGFWVTNHLANPILRPLLRSRAGRRLGRHLAVLRYRGRRTGQQHELVVQYARDGDAVWVLPGQADRKTWWRNFREPSDVEVWFAGENTHARGVVLDGRLQPDRVGAGLAVYLRQLPRARKALGIDADADLSRVAERSVLVRIDLHPDCV